MKSGLSGDMGGLGLLVVVVALVAGAEGAALDLATLIHQYEDQVLGDRGVRAITEDMDSQVEAEGESGHPVEVHGFGSGLSLGQVSAVDVDENNDPVIIHRGPVTWGGKSFDNHDRLKKKTLIEEDTILTLDQDTGEIKSSWGSGLFYMPHGLHIDTEGNTWVTDVGLHQVMKFPPGQNKPALVLGEKFVPGKDSSHFCKPTSVAVSSTGVVFVADGYCNSRVLVFDKDGNNLNRTITGDWWVVHSLALYEDEDVLCIANREGEKIECVKAGIHSPQLTGQRLAVLDRASLGQPLGRMFAIAGRGTALLAVNGLGSISPRGLTIDMGSSPRVVDTWGKQLVNPHDVALARGGDAVYVAEIGPNKITKFVVVVPKEDLF